MLQGRLGKWHCIKYRIGEDKSQVFFYRKNEIFLAKNTKEEKNTKGRKKGVQAMK